MIGTVDVAIETIHFCTILMNSLMKTLFLSILIDRISQEDVTQILYFARLTGFPSRCPAKSCRFFSRNVIFLQNPVHPAGTSQ